MQLIRLEQAFKLFLVIASYPENERERKIVD
jgi:hypothetical protein